MTEQEIIDSVRQARKEEVRFFSSTAKPERERWVVREFLTWLGLGFSSEEVQSPPEGDPVDVSFRSASFQIKEICDPTERRHGRLKKSLWRAEQAITARDLFGSAEGRDIVFIDVVDLLIEVAASSNFSPRVKDDLDLLFYVTRPHASFYEPCEVASDKLRSFGWRSISCLFGQKPLLLLATDSSPPFLRPS